MSDCESNVDPEGPNFVQLVISLNTTNRLSGEETAEMLSDVCQAFNKYGDSDIEIDVYPGGNIPAYSNADAFDDDADCYDELVMGSADVIDIFAEENSASAQVALDRIKQDPEQFVEDIITFLEALDKPVN
jgi:hypothetical protein